MPRRAAVDDAIRAGLEYLAGQQLRDGGFASYSSSSAKPFRPDITYKTTFTASLILSALADAEVPGAAGVRARAAGFVRAQAGPQGSYNYWAKRVKERRSLPYPDDLDDTFCALAALYSHDPAMVDASVLARATKLLLATESAVGGPYRTWLVSADSEPIWLDIDIAVNANVAYFLTLLESPLPKLTSFLDDAVRAGVGKLRSPYYPSAYIPAYYIARGYNGRQQSELIKILRGLLERAGTELETALCVSSLARLGVTTGLDKAIGVLLDAQGVDGAWPVAAFCLDPALDGQAYYNGAPALTTAFVLEALQLHSRTSNEPGSLVEKHGARLSSGNDAVILKMAEDQCRSLGPDLRAAIRKLLRLIAKSKNGPEITGLASSFRESLEKPPRRLPNDFVEKLGLANLYGWLAYTIYDDFLDEEGKPELISVANVAMRRSLDNYFQALPSDTAFHRLVRQTFDTIDSANAWELAHCRFAVRGKRLVVGTLPGYGNLSKLAERSIGHALSPLAVLAAAGQGPDTAAARNLLKAFRHYLIARQLNDDAHDWPEDLQNGHITAVVARLLAEMKIKPGEHAIDDLLSAGRPQFWRSTLPGVCQLMRRHVRLSRQALKAAAVLKPDNAVARLLDNLDKSIDDTLAQQGQAETFLKHYRRPAKKGAKA